MERVMGIEPTQPAWKAGILAIELHPRFATVIILSKIRCNVNILFAEKRRLKNVTLNAKEFIQLFRIYFFGMVVSRHETLQAHNLYR